MLLKVAEDSAGGVVLTNRAGDQVAATPQARIWDGSVNAASGLPVHEIAVDTQLAKGPSGWVMRVAVPAEFFDREGLVYPVTVDPSVSLQTLGDTFIEKGYNDTNFAGEDDLRVGTYDGGTHVARSYLKFKFGSESPNFFTADTIVTGAKLHLFEYWSSSCTATQIDSHQGTASWSATSLTWNNRTGYVATADGSVTEAHGYSSSCPAAWLAGSTGIDVTQTVAVWATGTPNYGIVLDAANETDSKSWKRFYSGEYSTTSKRPYLTVSYQHRPATPSAMAVGPFRDPYTNDTTPDVTAAVSDLDGGNVRAAFQLMNSAGTTPIGSVFYTPYRSGSGTTPPVTVPTTLTHGQSYRMRVWGNDGVNTSTNYLPSMLITVDTAPPTISGISCSNLTMGAWTTAVPSSSTCTVSSSDVLSGVVATSLSVDGTALSPTSAGANTFALTAAARKAGYHSYSATVSDKALNSTTKTGWYGVGAPSASMSAPVTGLRSSRNFPIQATGPAGAASARVEWRVAGGVWAAIPTASPSLTTSPGAAWNRSVNASGGIASTPPLTWDATSVGMPDGGSLDVRVCFVYSGAADVCAGAPPRVQLVPHAFGGSFATAGVGGGQVSLSTGELQVSTVDAALPGGNSDISVGRTWLSLAGTLDTGFGAGWQADLPADASPGVSDATVIDRTNVDGSLLLVYPEGDADVFVCTKKGITCEGDQRYQADGETALTGASLVMSADGKILTYTDADTVATTFERAATTSTTWTAKSVSDPSVQKGASQPPAGSFSSALAVDGYGIAANDKYRAVLAPKPAGVGACAWTAGSPGFGLARGCAALTVVTASDTTAVPASGATGDYPKHIKAVITTVWDPQAGAMSSKVVARYAYDSSGKLVAEWDPRDTLSAGVLSTRYGYGTAGGRPVLTSVTPASAVTGGLAPTTYGYDGSARLTTASRTGAGSTETTTIAYGLGLSGTNLPSLTTTAAWGQDVPPVTGVEVFGPGSSPQDPRSGTITYLDTVGRALNVAAYGAGAWNVSATAYTAKGQVAWSLTPGNRARALAGASQPGDPAALAGDSAARARVLRTDNVYDDQLAKLESPARDGDPSLLVDSFGPLADVTLADGTVVSARAHTRTSYDEGAPTSAVTDADGGSRSGPWRLATTVKSSASVFDTNGASTWPDGTPYTDRDVATARNDYDNTGGFANAGWLFASPTKVTMVDVAGGHDLVTVSVLDERGRVVQSRQPKSDGTDAGTTVSVYYAGDDSAPGTACDGRPEWAGLACRVGPAGQPAGASVPTTTTTYTRDLAVAREVEVSGSMTRTATTGYDAGGRVISSATVADGAPSGDRAVPETTTTYWPETGLTKSVTAGGATATTSYDVLGRVTSQSDGAGNTATTDYDSAGRVKVTNDGKASTSYGYDGQDAAGKAEFRGLVTSKAVAGLVGAQGEFKAAYDADGALMVEVHPNGMTATTVSDPAGQVLDQTWRAADGSLLTQSTRSWGSDGNVVTDSGLGRESSYRYDGADRLVRSSTVLDMAGSCTVREYAFDDDSNRTGLNVWAGAAGSCPAGTGTPDTASPRGYDSAGRATLSGYSYDDLGRTRALPGADSPTGADVSFTYFGNDLVASMSAAGTTREYGLDASGRIASWTDTVGGAGGQTSRNHYDDGSGSPAWTENGDGTWTRPVTGIGGSLALTVSGDAGGPTATTGQISDLHGDVVATIANTDGANTLASATTYSEYGAQADGTTQTRYGWLGGKQRQTEALTGLLPMGVRLYNTLTGRFLQVDPVPGGSAGPYLYPTNPITGYDLDGCWWTKRQLLHKAVNIAAGFVGAAAAVAICGVTAGVGCVVIAGAVFGGATAFVGHSYVALSTGEAYTPRNMAKWMGSGLVNGAFAARGKFLLGPKLTPAKVKVAIHYGKKFIRQLERAHEKRRK